jgi:hypothetical protein
VRPPDRAGKHAMHCKLRQLLVRYTLDIEVTPDLAWHCRDEQELVNHVREGFYTHELANAATLVIAIDPSKRSKAGQAADSQPLAL